MTFTPKMRASLTKYPLTRRGYELIADCLRQTAKVSDLTLYQWRTICEIFADELEKQPGFNRARFLRACEGK